MKTSKSHILRTINVIASEVERMKLPSPYNCGEPARSYTGLCAAFERTVKKRFASDWDRDYEKVSKYLTAVGGEENFHGYFWDSDLKGMQERLTFLAFMLVWHEDCRGKAA